VLAIGVVAVIMTLTDMHPMHKAAWLVIVFFLAFIENRAINKDRADFAAAEACRRQEERQQFSRIADNIGIAIKEGMEHFDKTMRQFAVQNSSLFQLRQQNKRLAQQISDMPLSTMLSKDLADHAHEAAKQMEDLLQRYIYEDNQIANEYEDYRIDHAATMTSQQISNLRKQETKKRTHLRMVYEVEAKKAIAIATRLRAEMVKRLVPSNRIPDDTSRANWFEHPISGKTVSFLYNLAENANYLTNLAQRLISQ